MRRRHPYYYDYDRPAYWGRRRPSMAQEACCFSEGACCALGGLDCLECGDMTLLAVAVKLLLATPGPADPGGPAGRIARRLHTAVGYYRREISPTRPPCCRFTPTCSAYAQAALAEHGALRGSWLTVRRLLRCRPGVARGTADPLPA